MAVERKYERDIDVLLAEEFSVSPAFASWFLSKTKFGDRLGLISDLFVSKSDSDGESDLVVVYALDDNSRIAILIEDKVDALLQPEQAGRYRKRADREVTEGSFSEYEVILCAPEHYPASHGKTIIRDQTTNAAPLLDDNLFDRFLSYEQIADGLTATDVSPRAQYRATFVRTAAQRRSNQWVREQDDATDAFWEAIYRVASEDFPILEMKLPRLTKNSSWITLRPRDMPTRPRKVYIEFKARLGNIDLTFTNTRARLFAGSTAALLQEGMTIHQTGQSTAIRITSPAFDVESGLDVGLPHARLAMQAAKRLVEFYREYRGALDAAAEAGSLRES